MRKCVSAEAHGKLILIGEHSVVYQHGALVAPFTQARTVVNICEGKQGIYLRSDYHHGDFFAEEAPIEGLQALLRTFLDDHQLTEVNVDISISSNMLSRRGLGSSAAVAKALSEALFQFFGLPYEREDILHYIAISELVYHVKPSGIDMHAIMSDDLLWYQSGHITPIKTAVPLYLVVADSGQASQTKLSVSMVAEQVNKGDDITIKHLKQLGELALVARQQLEGGTLTGLSRTFQEAHSHLQAIGVSSPELDQLVTFATQHHALAAKMTGGGQGGCMFAVFASLTECQHFAKLLAQRGVTHSWIMTIA